MRSLYRRAISYSYVLNPINYIDRVHSSFLSYFESTGKNLFEEHEGFVFRRIKWLFLSEWKDDKRFSEYEEEVHYHLADVDIINSQSISHIHTIVKNYKSNGISPLSGYVLLKFLNYLERGYEVKEICHMMQISPQTASNYKKKLRTLLDHLKSPFNGSKTLFPKKNKITRKVYESHPDKYVDFIYDPVNYDCDQNEFYTQLVKPDTNEYLLIIQK